MAISRDIPRAWIRPATVMGERLKHGANDRIAFVYVAVGTVLGFVAQLPVLVRRSREPDPVLDAAIVEEAGDARILAVPADLAQAKFEAMVSGALLGWIFLMPLILYAVAMVSHWIARLVGGKGTALRARIALFWSFLVITPGLLLAGLTTGFVGPGPAANAVGIVTICAFIWVWVNSIYVAERPE
ncbi:hypothetical protein [Jannaschia aquimarina]|uniref:Yip1 domain protein n=1 Tax=Jannaschia aquimarina TaxID=935700 RepID=A0A0D1EQJ6_9RHOB|nr:hypothetical protein [Jannaschia aquimarina]KIT17890.1 Yip1 domain protein [Jannaschia aquimarina]SNT14009.1 hypothetical protein SAMN05421775_106156 [Jannaschia aquimarina]